MKKLQLLVVLVLSFVCNFEIKAQFKIDSSSRSGIASAGTISSGETNSFSTDELGQIVENALAMASDFDGYAFCETTQTSNVYPFGILASGSSTATGKINGMAFTDGELEVFFSLDDATPYRLSGEIDGGHDDLISENPGDAHIRLDFDGEILHSIWQEEYFVPVTFDFSGTLEPGTYRFAIITLADVFFDSTDECCYDVSLKVGLLIGDVNLDGVVSLLDVAPFVELITNGEFQAEADINQDGTVDLLDVAPFVALLTGG